MRDFLEAIAIFQKYAPENWSYPFHCEHDTLYICGVGTENVPEEDLQRLEELGFHTDSITEGFYSFKYGSC